MEIGGVVFIIFDGQRVLMEKCPKKAKLYERVEWFLPGGSVKENEVPSEAMVREMGEELGVYPLAFRPLPCIETRPGKITRPYLVTRWDGELPLNMRTLDGGTPLRWWHIPMVMNSELNTIRAMIALASTEW